jgi:hypothetical protein
LELDPEFDYGGGSSTVYVDPGGGYTIIVNPTDGDPVSYPLQTEKIVTDVCVTFVDGVLNVTKTCKTIHFFGLVEAAECVACDDITTVPIGDC